jgi:hypothetical protein
VNINNFFATCNIVAGTASINTVENKGAVPPGI